MSKRLCYWVIRGLILTLTIVVIMIYFLDRDQENIINNGFQGSTSQNYNAVEFEMKRRLFVIQQVCKQTGLGKYSTRNTPLVLDSPTPHYEIYYFDRGKNYAWCPIYKVASTSWLYNFALMSGVNETYLQNPTMQYSEIARLVIPSLEYYEGEEMFKTSKLRFFIVRHPFERLLSVYRDKFEDINAGKKHGTKFFHQKYGKTIVEKYRKNNSISRIEPTFGEFIDYVNDHKLGPASDEHWMPYYLYCTPCHHEFDAIVKMETMERDQRYIIDKVGLQNVIKPMWIHLTKSKETVKMIQKYFSVISKSQLLLLYDKYKIDFEMFEYTIDDYLPFVK